MFAYYLAPPKGELSAKPTERGQTFSGYGMRGGCLYCVSGDPSPSRLRRATSP